MFLKEMKVRIIWNDCKLENKEKYLRQVKEANVTIDDCFAVHDIKILEGSKGLYIRMPSRKTPEGDYKDIAHPTNNETRDALAKIIIAKYEAEKANQE